MRSHTQSDIPAFTPANSSWYTRFGDPGGMQGRVDLVVLVTYRGGIAARRRSLIAAVLTGLNVEYNLVHATKDASTTPNGRRTARLVRWLQVRRHGAVDNRWQVRWRRVFTEWSACHCATCTCHRLKLRTHLPAESAARETQSSEGRYENLPIHL